jgi:hypothetical protein
MNIPVKVAVKSSKRFGPSKTRIRPSPVNIAKAKTHPGRYLFAMRMVKEIHHMPLLLLPAQADVRAVAVVPVQAAIISSNKIVHINKEMAGLNRPFLIIVDLWILESI